MSGTGNPGFVQGYQNFQLPAGSFWVDPPTMQNLLNDVPPQIASTNPNLYYPGGNVDINTMASYTDPTSGQSVEMAPWPVAPQFQPGGAEQNLSQLIVSPAIPSPGGTLNPTTGTYSDPGVSGAPETTYTYDPRTETATPTQQSLDITLKNIEQHQMPGWGSFLMGLPMEAFGAVMAAGLPGMLAGALGTAGAGAADLGDVATLGSFGDVGSPLATDAASLGADVAPAGYTGDIATLGSFADTGASGGGASDLLGNAMQAYSQAKPYIQGGQDLLKLAQAFSTPQQTQTQPVSLLAQPAMVHR